MNKAFRWLYFALIAGCVTACSNTKQHDANKSIKVNKANTSDTLAYIWKNSDNGDTVGKGYHYHETLSYPEFKNEKLLNDTISSEIGNLGGWVDKPDTKDDKNVNTTDSGNQVDTTEVAMSDASQELSVNVVAQYPGLIVIDFSQGQTGGAHPNSTETYLNWNTKMRRAISLNELLIDGYSEKLDIVGEKLFREQYELSAEGNLSPYFGDEGKFYLTDNFYIEKDGLNFVYGSYTIASYAQGYPSLLIPYSSIKKLLRPHTVISQFIK